MAAKPASIASLVRNSAKSEKDFADTLSQILMEEGDTDRVVEFLTRLNLPKTMETSDDRSLDEAVFSSVTDFDTEMELSNGFSKFVDRHIRKLKWHVSHPAMDGIEAVTLLYRSITIIARLRIKRLIALLKARPVLTSHEWGTCRELLNRTFRDFRQATDIVTGAWLEAMLENLDKDEVKAALQDMPMEVRRLTNSVSALRDEIESTRLTMGVKPDGYPEVRPPRYFGGDILEGTSWKHFWGEVSNMTDSLYTLVQI